jgi:hypothetical protein
VKVSEMPATLFITLNVLDAFVTKAALAVGAMELNPMMTTIGSSMIVKGALALALVFLLFYFGKERTLWPLNLMLFGVVLWNLAVCGVMS